MKTSVARLAHCDALCTVAFFLWPFTAMDRCVQPNVQSHSIPELGPKLDFKQT